MAASDWLSSDNETILWRKLVSNLAVIAEDLGEDPQDWTSDDNPTDLLRKAVHNSFLITGDA